MKIDVIISKTDIPKNKWTFGAKLSTLERESIKQSIVWQLI